MSKAWSVGLSFVMMALLIVVMTGCEGEKGPAGASGTAECMNCHTDDFAAATFLLPYQEEYLHSQHYNGDTFVRREGEASGCSKCHTNEGFQHYVATGEYIDVSASTKVGCFTCHAPHTNGDFTLRAEGPIELLIGGTYDKGASGVCVVCHQARVPSPLPADGAEVTSTRWGPHYSPQSTVLAGIGAYQLPGAAFATTHSHNTLDNGCIACHMAELPEESVGGGHSFAVRHGEDELINSRGCVECHSGDFSDDDGATDYVEAFQTAFDADLDALRQDMRTLGWLNASSDRIIAQTFAEGDDMGAILNFFLLLNDHSHGVHNPTFARDLLTDTQAYVDTRMP